MSHSYEEIRTAAFDVLSGRVASRYGTNQYGHLKVGVAIALSQRDGGMPTDYHGDPQLDEEDADTFLEIFWDLFRSGIITLGFNDANREFPFFRLTALGKRIVDGEGVYFVHDVSAYEKRIKKEIPKIDSVTLIYLKESLQSFRSGCILSATVMLGVATEHTFLLLLEATQNSKNYKSVFNAAAEERTILAKVNKFRRLLEPLLSGLPTEIKEDLDTNFSGILSIIRNFRNQSGHPSGKIIDREQAYVLLQLFPPYCRKMYQLMKHFS